MTEQKTAEQIQALRPQLGGLVSAIEKQAPYGSVSLSSRTSTTYQVDNQQEQVTPGKPRAGSILTAFDGETMYERAQAGFDLDRLKHAVDELTAGADFSDRTISDLGGERRGDYRTPMDINPWTMSIQEKLDALRELNSRINQLDSKIVNVRVRFAEINETSLFRNRTADLYQEVTRVHLMILVTAMGEKGAVMNWATSSGTGGWEQAQLGDQELHDMTDTCLKLLEAERIEPGTYQVITSPSVSGVICHESFGHGVETDMFLKGRAKAAHYLDKQIGSELVDIYDDPSVPGALGSYFFDDEGYPAERTQIVRNGIFERGITDQYSAAALGIPRSPNGRRQDFTRKIYPRMSNTFFGAGQTPFEELLERVDRGIYLPKVSSGMEDPKGWGIQVTCHYGYEIKDGRLTDKMYAPVGLTGYVPEVLGSISGVGDSLELSGGMCGKGTKEMVPVSDGGPHLLLEARLG